MMKQQRRTGFTIIELMIATVVFALVLLIVMGAIIQFGRIYYKGVIQSRIQERARAISDDIAKHIQFSKSVTSSQVVPPPNVDPNLRYICAGGKSYTFRVGQERVGNEHSLVSTNTCSPYAGMSTLDLSGGASVAATELLGERMQLANLTVTPSGDDRYIITVRVAYGEDTDFEGDNPANSCKPIVFGGQFCAVSELKTTVTRRLK